MVVDPDNHIEGAISKTAISAHIARRPARLYSALRIKVSELAPSAIAESQNTTMGKTLFIAGIDGGA